MELARNVATVASVFVAVVFGLLGARQWSRERRLEERIERTLNIASKLEDHPAKPVLMASAGWDSTELAWLRLGVDIRRDGTAETRRRAVEDLTAWEELIDSGKITVGIFSLAQEWRRKKWLQQAYAAGQAMGLLVSFAIVVSSVVLSGLTGNYWYATPAALTIAISVAAFISGNRRHARGTDPVLPPSTPGD